MRGERKWNFKQAYAFMYFDSICIRSTHSLNPTVNIIMENKKIS